MFDHARLSDDVVVVVADGAAAYLGGLDDGVQLADMVATLAPPFRHFFVEFSLRADKMGIRAAGVLFEVLRARGTTSGRAMLTPAG